ncbi:MAG: hypothetical protein IJB53_04125 [Mailhella sp.]|nr:hypothetical protein [Mailhella sp.]
MKKAEWQCSFQQREAGSWKKAFLGKEEDSIFIKVQDPDSGIEEGLQGSGKDRAEKFSFPGSKSLEWANHGLWMLQLYYALLIFEHADFVDMLQGGTHFPQPRVLALRCQSGILA